jgi:ribosomal protein S18 acetylase RimI-like enzyme
MIGFSLNGFGIWDGKRTVYDAGTGVIPTRRRSGASEAMFELMVPKFRADGVEQFLLEVITANEPAVNLYKKLGFEIQRELLLLEASGKLEPDPSTNQEAEIRSISAGEFVTMTAGWDGNPSWQNSNEAVMRSEPLKTILGAFLDGELAGYIVFSTGLGRVAQFFVHRSHRNKGIGARLLAEMGSRTNDGAKMQVINVDRALIKSVDFFRNRGFREVLAQYEMVLPL